MKHPNNRRPIIAALVLVLILSVLPVAALADTLVFQDIYDNRNGNLGDPKGILSSIPLDILPSNEKESQTISIRDYDRWIRMDGKYYEFLGMGSWNAPENTPYHNNVESITIPPFPGAGTEEEKAEWFQKYGEISVVYGPHTHEPLQDLWFNSATNHWRYCKHCGQVYGLNWHWDRDEDGICDDCGMEIIRYPITVLEFEGGKVTVSQKDGAYNDIIEVTVETDPGYTFKQIHFYQLDEKRHELTRWVDEFASQYHFKMPYHDVEIETEFVKN